MPHGFCLWCTMMRPACSTHRARVTAALRTCKAKSSPQHAARSAVRVP
jgi:hypothetical protein